MNKDALLKKLEELFSIKEVQDGFKSREDCLKWVNKVAPLLKFNQQYYQVFYDGALKLNLNLSADLLASIFRTMTSQVQMAIEELKNEMNKDGRSHEDNMNENKYNILEGSISYREKIKDEKKYKCFVIMPIGKKNTVEYANNMLVFSKIIEPCVTNSGYNIVCYHADLITESGDISKQVIDALKNDDIVIADLRRNNVNVLYELGIRHTFGKRSILICSHQNEQFFYTKTYRAIEYKIDGTPNQDFYNRLSSQIDGIIKNPYRSDNPVTDTLGSLIQLNAVSREEELASKPSLSKPKAGEEDAGQEKEFYRLVAAGTQFESSNRHDLATECFEDALKIKPDNIRLHLDLSVIYGEKIGDPESKQRAINHCEEVIKIDPNNLSAKFNLAVYTNHIKGSKESLPVYLEAEKLIRKQGMLNSLIDGKLNIFIGHDYKNTGNKKEAKPRYEKAIVILNNLAQKGDSNSAFWRDDAQTNLKKLLEETAKEEIISFGNGSKKLNKNRRMSLSLLTIISMFLILLLTPVWEDAYKSFKTYMIKETHKNLVKPFSDTASIISARPLAFVPYTPKNPEVPGQKKAIIIAELKLRDKKLANNVRVNFEIEDGTGRHVTSEEWNKISGQQGLVFSMFYPDVKLVQWTPDIPYTGIEAIAANRQKPFKLWIIVSWEDLDGTEHKLKSYSELRYDENSKLYYFDERENTLLL